MQNLYDSIMSKELFSPLTRSWYEGKYNEADLTICDLKTSLIKEEQSEKLNLNDFVSTADLTRGQLFNYNNRFDTIVDEDRDYLIVGALRQVISVLTNKYLSIA